MAGKVVPSWFISSVQKGTGSEASVAHGLGRTPTVVFAFLISDTTSSASITEGTHTDVYCKFDVTQYAQYHIVAG